MALRLDSRHLLLTYGTSAPAESLSRDPSHIRSQSLRGQPGCSTWLARYLRDHLRVEPPPPWARSGFRPLPAVCIGQDPRPAPSALRTPAPPRPRGPATGSRGAGPRAAASPRRGGREAGGGASPVRANQRRDHIHANTSTMERAHHSPLQASLKWAFI